MKTINHFLSFVLFSFLLSLTVGCKSDDPKIQVTTSSVTDIDGNVYKAISIGTQTWMVENLRTTKYRNGDSINLKLRPDSIYIATNGDTIRVKRNGTPIDVLNNSVWSTLNIGAQCVYNNSTNADSISKYGRLYNYYALTDSRNIAPEGWHIPTSSEWIILQNYVNAHLTGSGNLAKSLAASTNWNTTTEVGAIGNDLSLNNLSGFSALPGGYRYNDGKFEGTGVKSSWWSCSNGPYLGSAWYMGLFHYYNDKIWSVNALQYGLSVRCIKDAK